MATTIKQRTIGGSSDKAVQLSSSQFGRSLSLPTGWNKIRVGVRVHMGDTGVNLGGTPVFAAGFGHGTTNMVGDANCDNWIGFVTNDATVLRTAVVYQWDINTLVVAKKVGAVLTTGGALNTGTVWQIGNQALAAAADRTVLFVDVTKGAPNYTVNTFWHGNVAITDITQTLLLTQMVLDSPTLAGHTYSAGVTIAFDETAGALDTFQIWWDNAVVMEFSDVAVAVLS